MEDRILIFAMDGDNLLAGGSWFLFDMTFKCYGSLFCQFYTIHVDFGSTKGGTHIIPAVYALPPDKKRGDVAAINASEEVFPTTVIKGCNSHFKALCRKEQDLDLTKLYKENEEIRNYITKCAVLAHLPEEKVTDDRLCIMENSPID
ncbi:hypothetical protein Trydic_g7656 [Trypoxylus dichotomus]